jgi:hypothetical protein
MNNEPKKLKDMTDDELVAQAAIKYKDLTNNRPMAKLTRRLMDSIKSLDKTTSFYSKWLMFLTIVTAVLTFITVIQH